MRKLVEDAAKSAKGRARGRSVIVRRRRPTSSSKPPRRRLTSELSAAAALAGAATRSWNVRVDVQRRDGEGSSSCPGTDRADTLSVSVRCCTSMAARLGGRLDIIGHPPDSNGRLAGAASTAAAADIVAD